MDKKYEAYCHLDTFITSLGLFKGWFPKTNITGSDINPSMILSDICSKSAGTRGLLSEDEEEEKHCIIAVNQEEDKGSGLMEPQSD